jgi:tRNA threonylcarbamoyladenosine modification (KEOPS) complex  Pcc1 subunit
MKHRASLVFRYHDPLADAIARALQPEAAQSEVPKTRGEVRRDGDAVLVDIAADDLPSLRASVNSHLRWVDAAARAASIAQTLR